MRVRGRAAAGVLAAGMALTLVAAESAPATPQGTASTSMFGADITVTNFPALEDLQLDAVDSIGARLMELTSFATTVDDPFAQTSVIPLLLPDGTTVGAVEARSDGDTSGSSILQEFGDPLGALDVSVNPITTTAHAGANSAVASIQAAVAELAALGEVLGVDITTPGITSIVGNTGAVATQGIQVSELGLNLAALQLTGHVLELLGIDQVLALLAGFGIEADAIDTATEALADIDGIQSLIGENLGVLSTLGASIEESVEGLGVVGDILGDLDLLDLDPADLLGGLLGGSLADILAGLLDGECDVTCVEEVLTEIAGALETDLGAVLDVVASLDGLLAELAVVLDGLDAVLELVQGLLPALADTQLLTVGAFDVGVTARATDSIDTSSATVLCDEVTVTVFGAAPITTPKCSEGVALVAGAAGQVTDAVTGLAGILESALPISGLDGLKVDVFSGLVENVSEVDGRVVAEAGLNLLEMVIPSLSLDVGDPLGLLDVLAPLEAIIATVTQGLDDLDEVNEVLDALLLDGLLDDALAALGALEDAVTGEDGLAELVSEVEVLIDLVNELGFGTLEGFTTPGIALTIDPTSTASFQAGAPVTPGAPDPDDTPELPVTGGSLALLGLLAISGAAAMRRRRN